ncbi:MAG: hypothetical protein AAGJ52_13720 [Pseudomonadota bacterium]
MNRKSITLFFVATSSLIFGNLAANDLGPEETVIHYFSAIEDRGINDVAHLIHPDEALRFREMVFPLIEQMANSSDKAMLDSFFGTDSVDEIADLSPVQFMNSFTTIIASNGISVNYEDVRVIGVVPENEDRHVLVRFSILGQYGSAESLEVVTVRKHSGTWMATLSGELEGFGKQVQAQSQ